MKNMTAFLDTNTRERTSAHIICVKRKHRNYKAIKYTTIHIIVFICELLQILSLHTHTNELIESRMKKKINEQSEN